MMCPLCSEEADELLYEFEQYVLDVIKKEHPEWVESDGACPRCLDYYRSLDSAIQITE